MSYAVHGFGLNLFKLDSLGLVLWSIKSIIPNWKRPNSHLMRRYVYQLLA